MRSRRLFTGLGVLLAVAFAPSTGGAQVDTARVVTASMLKRLGEVVDGNRTGGTIYVVMSYRSPFDVAAVTGTLDSAQLAARAAAGQYGVFGPYLTQSESPQGQAYAMILCPKDQRTSLFVCPDTGSSATTVHAVPMSWVTRVEFSVHTRDGQVHTQSFTPDHVEAVFFTLAAIDKFAIPYYERVLGLPYATALRARMQQWFQVH